MGWRAPLCEILNTPLVAVYTTLKSDVKVIPSRSRPMIYSLAIAYEVFDASDTVTQTG